MQKAIIGLSPFLVQALSIALNFNALRLGSAANAVNIIVSILYFSFWIRFIRVAKKSGAQRGLDFSLVLWGLVLLTALLTLSVNIFDFDLPGAIPLAILFLTPIYGVRIAQLSNVAALVIVALVAIAYFAYCITGLKQVKRK